MDFLLFFLGYILVVVGVLVSVAFLVLLERSVLGYIQLRKGPNKVGYLGILQSFGDAIKLFMKEQFVVVSSNSIIYYFSPVFSLFLMLVLWMIMPYTGVLMSFFLGGLILFCCLGFGVYTLMGSGWASNSSYAMLGATRGVAQTISYEVSMILIFLSLIVFCNSFGVYSLVVAQSHVVFLMIFLPVSACWVISCLAETNRTPFDFAEGESELVSGFNIEYGSGGFALLFLAEYGSIIFMSYIIVVLFLGYTLFNVFLFNVLGVYFCFWFIWVRGTMPRFRYDKLMYLAWKSFLPISLLVLFFYFGWVSFLG